MPVRRSRTITPRTLARRIAELANTKQALNIQVLDLRRLTDFTDYFVICSGAVDVHVKAITDFIEQEMGRMGFDPISVEGTDLNRWVLMDYMDVVVHIFQPLVREYYGLERLWADARRVKFRGITD